MLQSRYFPAGLVGLLIAAGCATAENAPEADPDDSPSGGSNHAGTLAGGSAGRPGGSGGSGSSKAGSGSGGTNQSGTASGGKAQGGAAGAGSGGDDDGGGGGSGGSGTAGKAGAAGSGGKGGTNQGGTAGSAGSGGGGSGSGSGGSGGSGGGGGKLGCDDPLYALCDDFEDANANGWSTSGGTWTVVQSGSYVYKGALGGYQAFAGDAAMTDQIVEASLKGLVFGGSGSSYRIGIIARRTSTSNFYAVTLDETGDLRVLKGSSSPSGSSGTCDAVAVSPPATGFTLRLAVTGPTGNVNIKTFLDGDPIHDCTTTSGTLAAGSAGLYTYGSQSVAEFDDFKVSLP